MSDVVYAVIKDGERVEFKANPTNLFASEADANKAKDSLGEKAEGAEVVAYRLGLTVVI